MKETNGPTHDGKERTRNSQRLFVCGGEKVGQWWGQSTLYHKVNRDGVCRARVWYNQRSCFCRTHVSIPFVNSALRVYEQGKASSASSWVVRAFPQSFLPKYSTENLFKYSMVLKWWIRVWKLNCQWPPSSCITTKVELLSLYTIHITRTCQKLKQ